VYNTEINRQRMMVTDNNAISIKDSLMSSDIIRWDADGPCVSPEMVPCHLMRWSGRVNRTPQLMRQGEVRNFLRQFHLFSCSSGLAR
jgi:hypothetical protein